MIDTSASFPSIPGPLDWWQDVHDFWRWTARASEILADDMAGDATRQSTRQRRIAALLGHVRTKSAFYSRHYRHVPPGCPDLAAYPPVTRARLMSNFDHWVTDPRIRLADLRQFIADPKRIAEPYLGEYTIWTSSGTTGVPGIYVQDADAIAVYSALITSRFEFGGFAGGTWQLVAGSARMAFIGAVGGHFAGVVSWERNRRRHPTMAATARAFSILKPLPDLVAQLNAWQPVFVATYPTMLRLLAGEHRAGRLTIEPRGLWCGGEGLTAADRAAIEEAFGCPVAEDYGASECMNMAFCCRHGRLHVNDDWVVLEPVDERLRPVLPGQASMTVLVTNLANAVQPLIRYDLGDSISFDEAPCACGSRRPSLRVEGRCDDVLAFDPADRGIAHAPIRVLPLAIETVIEEEAGVHRFQLTQTAANALSVRIDARDHRERAAAFRRVKRALERFLKGQGAAPVKMMLETAAPESNPLNGKLRQVRAAAAFTGSRGRANMVI